MNKFNSKLAKNLKYIICYAPNDNLMFAYFKHCVKIITKADCSGQIKPLTESYGGFGFAQATNKKL